MANALFDHAREQFLTGNIDWATDTFKIVLVDTAAYTVNLSTHQNLDDVAGVSRIATSGALASKTTTAGAADCADITFATVTGASIEGFVIYKDTGVEATSTLIGYVDTGTGLPITPNGGDIVLVVDNGSSKLFRL